MASPASQKLDGAVDGVAALRNSYASFRNLHVNTKVPEKQWQAAAAAAGRGPIPDSHQVVQRSPEEAFADAQSPSTIEQMMFHRTAGSGASLAKSMRQSRSGLSSPGVVSPESVEEEHDSPQTSSNGVQHLLRSRSAALRNHNRSSSSVVDDATTQPSPENDSLISATARLASGGGSSMQSAQSRRLHDSHSGLGPLGETSARRQQLPREPEVAQAASPRKPEVERAASSSARSYQWGAGFHSCRDQSEAGSVVKPEGEEEREEEFKEYDIQNFTQQRVSRFRSLRVRASASQGGHGSPLSRGPETIQEEGQPGMASSSSPQLAEGLTLSARMGSENGGSVDEATKRPERAPIPQTLRQPFYSIDLVEALRKEEEPEDELEPEPPKPFNVLDILPGPGTLDLLEREASNQASPQWSSPYTRPRTYSSPGINTASFARGGNKPGYMPIPPSYGPAPPNKTISIRSSRASMTNTTVDLDLLAEDEVPSALKHGLGSEMDIGHGSPTGSIKVSPLEAYGPLAARDMYVGPGGKLKVRERSAWQGQDGRWHLK